jgi:hypothetical protein
MMVKILVIMVVILGIIDGQRKLREVIEDAVHNK